MASAPPNVTKLLRIATGGPNGLRQDAEENHCGLNYSEASGRAGETRPSGDVVPESRRHYLYSWAWRLLLLAGGALAAATPPRGQ